MKDSGTLILAALQAGLAARGQATTSWAVKDTYTALKGLIQRCLVRSANSSEHNLALIAKYETKPDVWSKPLHTMLTEAKADQDYSVTSAAQQLLRLVERHQPDIAQHIYHTYGLKPQN